MKIKLPNTLNSIQSQNFGRRVYQVENGDHQRWLKLQCVDAHPAYEHGFLNELKIYDLLNRIETPDQSVIGNFSILDPYTHFQVDEHVIQEALWLEDLPILFVKEPNRLEAVELYKQLKLSLDVLEHLHAYGLVHGDLKKEHFRYKQEEGQARLIDFEKSFIVEANLNSAQPMLSHVATHDATPRYMAPELFHVKPKSVQSDIYALGIIWLEWLTQQRLSAKSYQDWAILHCQQLKIDLPEHFQPLFPVLEMMLMKKIDSRCSNIYQIKQVLSRIG